MMSLIELGKIVKPHGFKGAFLATSPTGRDSALGQLSSLLLGPNRDKLTCYNIAEASWMPRGWKLKLEGIDSDVQVEALRGHLIFAERSALPALGAGEFYIEDLTGAEVVDADTGVRLGTFAGVDPVGTTDRWWVATEQGEVGVPAVSRFVVEVQVPPVGRATIKVRHFEELL